MPSSEQGTSVATFTTCEYEIKNPKILVLRSSDNTSDYSSSDDCKVEKNTSDYSEDDSTDVKEKTDNLAVQKYIFKLFKKNFQKKFKK